MNITIHGKNTKVTQGMRDRVERKLQFLTKFFLIDENTNVNVVVKDYPAYQRLEVTIPTKVAILRAEGQADDFYTALDLIVDRLQDQIRRQKTRITKKHGEKLAKTFVEEMEKLEDFSEEEVDDSLVRTKQVRPVLMDLDEAILQMEMLGHSFFIYLDNETNSYAVVYKRHDGGYGLLETE